MNPHDKVVGLVELAKIASVSPSTVSRALSDDPRVAPHTRERILALATQHRFRLNQTASALRKKRTQAIGVVIPLGHEADQTLSDPFFMGLLGPLADALSARGYDLLLSRVIPRDDRWLQDLVVSGRVDGVIIVGQSDQTEVIEQVASRYAPLVVWGAHISGHSQISVGTDNVVGGRLAAEHLIAAGRRQLAFVGNPGVPEFAARLVGFRQAIAAAPDAVTETLVPVHLTTAVAYHEIAAFLTRHPPLDGIFAASDVIAMGAMQALAERGLSVPGDVAVVGYDDVFVARHTTPPLTTVRQDVGAGATMLVDILLRRLAGDMACSVQMVPQLIVRGSA
ncbi:MAG: LacI family DNA-binding transcriptional regulator [Sphingomonas sp.]